MTESQSATPAETAQRLARLAVRATQVGAKATVKSTVDSVRNGPDPLNIHAPMRALTRAMMMRPDEVWRRNMALWADSMRLWQTASARAMGLSVDPVITPEKGDRRWKDAGWESSASHDLVKQVYLLFSKHMMDAVQELGDLDPADRERLAFHTRQHISALSPSNFAATHPAVMKATIEQKGENLLRGFESLVDDIDAGGTRLRLRMSDETAFEVGRDVATAEGSVVFENDLIQLIQFAPTTGEVATRPLLVVPPWINKYYILDLRPKNSFIQWAVAQGYTVFCISWVNPDVSHRDLGFDDYLKKGTLAAIDAVEQATGVSEMNVVAYCLGGTLTAATLGYLAEKGDQRVKSATFMATLTDFSDPGEIRVFIDDKQITGIEKRMARRGYLEGFEMADSFRMLRENDLVWNYLVDQYLLGKEPTAFDLLYWNEDTTRMPERMHSFYLREMYLHNRLVEPGGITLDGVAIDLRKVDIPVYMLSCDRDHIAPWQTTYKATQLYSGETTFVLGGSGHIAGVVNPPVKNRYGFKTAGTVNPESPDAWLESAQQNEGSWWPHWSQWLSNHAGESVAARTVADGGLPELEPAPGRFAKTRIS